jgi:hypothetical protein
LLGVDLKITLQEENKKTLYISDSKNRCMHIIPDKAFEECLHPYVSKKYLKFEQKPIFGYLSNNDHHLCIGFLHNILIYDISEDPLCPSILADLTLPPPCD